LGGGSFSTISEFMVEWRTLRAKNEPREAAPKAVTDRLTELGNDIWSAALEIAHQRLASEREAFDLQRTEIERRLVEATGLADQMSEELESTRGKLAEAIRLAEERIGRAESEREQARQESVEAREAAALVRGQLAAVEKQNQALLDRLSGSLPGNAPLSDDPKAGKARRATQP
jgi:chromosome segregation ATPase